MTKEGEEWLSHQLGGEAVYTEVVQVGDTSFVYFPGEGGGRLIPAKQIKSIVPDFKGSGSMVFLTDSDKAVKVKQLPIEIINDIIEQSEASEAE